MKTENNICKECQFETVDGTFLQDRYDQQFESLIYYILFGKWTRKIDQMNDELTRHSICQILKDKSKKLKIKQCPRLNYHLVCIETGKVLPMVRRAHFLIQQLHGYEHSDPTSMKKKMKDWEKYDSSSVMKYLYKFAKNCRYCSRTQTFTAPRQGSMTQDIREALNYIENKSLDLSRQQQAPQQNKLTYQYLRKSLFICSYKCENDKYCDINEDMRYYLEKRQFPQHYVDLGPEQRDKKKHWLQVNYFYYKLFRCNRNTNHLWKIKMGSKNDSKSCLNIEENHMKIPMKQELLIITKLAHSHIHNSVKEILNLLRNASYFVKIFREYIYNNTDYCQECALEREKDPIIKMDELYRVNYKKYKGKGILIQQGKRIRQKKNKVIPPLDEIKLDWRMVSKKELKNNRKQNIQKQMKLSEQEICFKRKQILKQILNFSSANESHSQLIIKWALNSETPVAILITSQGMIRNYKKYGDCVIMQKFNDLIWSEENWEVYIFSGIDAWGCNRIFAISFLSNESFQNFCYIINLFFQNICKEDFSITLCTHYNTNIKTAIESLKYYSENKDIKNISHIFSWASALEYFLQDFQNDKQKHELMQQHLTKILRLKSRTQFISEMKRVKQMLGKKWQQFIENEKGFILCSIPPKFNGYSHNLDRTSKFEWLIRQHIGCHTNLLNLFKKLNTLDRYCQQNSMMYQIFSFYQIKRSILDELNSYLSPFIVSKILKNIQQSDFLFPVKFKENSYIFTQKFQNNNVQTNYSLQLSCWNCSCNQIYIYGIPCPHIIHLVNKFNGSLRRYINSRWFI